MAFRAERFFSLAVLATNFRSKKGIKNDRRSTWSDRSFVWLASASNKVTGEACEDPGRRLSRVMGMGTMRNGRKIVDFG